MRCHHDWAQLVRSKSKAPDHSQRDRRHAVDDRRFARLGNGIFDLGGLSEPKLGSDRCGIGRRRDGHHWGVDGGAFHCLALHVRRFGVDHRVRACGGSRSVSVAVSGS